MNFALTALKVLKIAALSWIALVVTVSGLSGMVFCIGTDGHFSFELASQGHGTSPADAQEDGQHAATEMSAAAGSGHDGDCVDVSLSLGKMSQSGKQVRHDRLSKSTIFQPLADTCVNVDGPHVPSSRREPQRGAWRDRIAFLLAQRTVVLRV